MKVPKDDNSERCIHTILGKKMDLLGAITNSLMVWWVSSVVFIGSAIGGTFAYSEKVVELGKWRHLYFSIGSAFTLCVAAFGYVAYKRLGDAERQFADLLALLKIDVPVPAEFRAVRQGTFFGLVMFLVLSIPWFILWMRS